MAAASGSAPRPGVWERQRGCVFSCACAKCREGDDTQEAALRRQHAAAGGAEGMRWAARRVCPSLGGDMKGELQVLRHAGANATYPCGLCLGKLHETYKKGVPHLRKLPEEWAAVDN